MLPLKSVSFKQPIPFAGSGLSAATEAMGLSIVLLPAIRCVRMEVVKGGSRYHGTKVLIPLEGVLRMEEADPDAPLAEAPPPAPNAPQTCDFGGTGNDVDPSNLFQF